jgi:hypothetical protein
MVTASVRAATVIRRAAATIRAAVAFPADTVGRRSVGPTADVSPVAVSQAAAGRAGGSLAVVIPLVAATPPVVATPLTVAPTLARTTAAAT